MKIRKNSFLILLMIVLNFSCNKDSETIRTNYIIAGEIGNGIIYKDFNPDIEVSAYDPKMDSTIIIFNSITNKYDTILNILDTSIYIDLNSDSKNDLKFKSTYSKKYIIYNSVIPVVDSINRIEIYSSGWNWSPSVNYYNGYLEKLDFNDTIKQNKLWTHSSGWGMFDANITEKWMNKENVYLGFRFIDKKDTLYGWMRLSVKSPYDLIIHDCAFQIK